MHFDHEENSNHETLLFVFILSIVTCFVFLILRLFQLTIVKGDYYRRLSDQNRIKELYIEPQRGTIRDRKGFVLTHNAPADITQNTDVIPSRRIYDSTDSTAQIIGYRQIADRNDLNTDNCLNKLRLGEKTGKKGVEKLYDCQLRGEYGKKLIEINAKGKYLQTLTVLPPKNGQSLQLSLDLELQNKVYDLLKDKQAAAVGVNPKTGEVLFLVSTPSFSPQNFEDQKNDIVATYFTDAGKPLIDRATEGMYPPGSIFKLVLATGALEDKVIDEHTQFEDTGILHAGSLTFGNWYYLEYGRTDGMVDIVKGIQRSNDIFFYETGNAMGPDRIHKWAGILGYGKDTGIGLSESEGMIPSPFWKQETLNDRWYTGDTYNFSIGQGYVTVTPIQTVMVTSVFANGGYLCQPQLLKDAPPNCKKLPIADKNIALIREGMKKACSPGGTGWPLFNFGINKNGVDKPVATTSANFEPIQTACKTGTAETPGATSMADAWLTAFAPYDNPQIAVSVLIEEGGQGSDVAGPVAKEILKAYFERTQ